MAKITLLEVAKRTGNDQILGLIEESLESAPEIRSLPVRYVPGTSYKTLKRTSFGGGGFRNANEGSATIKSTYEQALVELYFFDAQMEIDEQLVAADPQLLRDEGVGAVSGSMINLGQQVFQGIAKDSKGFDGFKNTVASEMIVDAAGTGSTETVYFVVEGGQGVHLPVNENTLLQLGEWVKQKLKDDDGNSYHAWCTNLSAWIGLQIGHKYAVGAVKNVTAAKPFTDALAAQLMSKFPVGMKPTSCFMSRNSAYYLQNSRSAVGQVDAGASGRGYAPMPTEVQGIPITVTDSIGLVAASSWS